jgi:hypothetical protein
MKEGRIPIAVIKMRSLALSRSRPFSPGFDSDLESQDLNPLQALGSLVSGPNFRLPTSKKNMPIQFFLLFVVLRSRIFPTITPNFTLFGLIGDWECMHV